MSPPVERRTFLSILGVALAGRSNWAVAQELSRQRSLAVIIGLANDTEMQARTSAFEQELEKKGWSIGRNIRIVYRFADNDTLRMQAFVKELVALQPDCILAHSSAACSEPRPPLKRSASAAAALSISAAASANFRPLACAPSSPTD